MKEYWVLVWVVMKVTMWEKLL